MPGLWAKMALGLQGGAELRLGYFSYSQDTIALGPRGAVAKMPYQVASPALSAENVFRVRKLNPNMWNSRPAETPSGRATGLSSRSSPGIDIRQSWWGAQSIALLQSDPHAVARVLLPCETETGMCLVVKFEVARDAHARRRRGLIMIFSAVGLRARAMRKRKYLYSGSSSGVVEILYGECISVDAGAHCRTQRGNGDGPMKESTPRPWRQGWRVPSIWSCL
ncbi:hypothetical protein PSPO01_03129 [Paraphaeosphaeria sporulosa]